MFDDLRQQTDESGFEQPPDEQDRAEARWAPRGQGRFLGMTAPQRFVIAVMLLIMVCLLGSSLLILSQKVVLPFLSF